MSIQCKIFRFVIFWILGLLLSACARGSAIVTGDIRPVCDPKSVKLYLEEPERYEVIGLVEASSSSGMTAQDIQDYAVNELKKQAAKLGANGVLLTTAGEKTSAVGGYGTSTTVGGYGTGTMWALPITAKTVSGKAIYVYKDLTDRKLDQIDRLKSFLFLYCKTYESKDLDKFAAFFTPDALENNRPFHLLLPQYRKNMDMIESFNYQIDLLEYSSRTSTGNIMVKGKYFTRFMYEGTLKENNGNISMELIENGNSYLVKQLNYTFRSEKKADKQSQWGPWIEIGKEE